MRVSMMDGAAIFMGQTLNDVLSMSNIEGGSLQLTMKPFDLHDLVRNAEIAVMGQVESRGQQLVVEGILLSFYPSIHRVVIIVIVETAVIDQLKSAVAILYLHSTLSIYPRNSSYQHAP